MTNGDTIRAEIKSAIEKDPDVLEELLEDYVISHNTRLVCAIMHIIHKQLDEDSCLGCPMRDSNKNEWHCISSDWMHEWLLEEHKD